MFEYFTHAHIGTAASPWRVQALQTSRVTCACCARTILSRLRDKLRAARDSVVRVGEKRRKGIGRPCNYTIFAITNNFLMISSTEDVICPICQQKIVLDEVTLCIAQQTMSRGIIIIINTVSKLF